MLELCFESTYLSFGNCAALLIPQTRVLSTISDVMTLRGHSVTICHLSPLALHVLFSDHHWCFFDPPPPPPKKKENHKLNAAIITFGSVKKKKKPFVAVNCLCVSKVLVRSSQLKEKSFYGSPLTLGSLSSCPQFHYQPLFSER